METALLSQIKGEGGLTTLQNLQRSALNRLLNSDKLNRMLSTKETLARTRTKPKELLSELYSAIVMESKTPLDLSKKAYKFILPHNLSRF